MQYICVLIPIALLAWLFNYLLFVGGGVEAREQADVAMIVRPKLL